jgi:hypothetical protein
MDGRFENVVVDMRRKHLKNAVQHDSYLAGALPVTIQMLH